MSDERARWHDRQHRDEYGDDHDESAVGLVGWCTVPIPDGGTGEVVLPIRGGTEAFAAWSDEPVAKHTRVVVLQAPSPRSVIVAAMS